MFSKTRDMHRAITSLMEELEAIDWYNQRIKATKDKELAGYSPTIGTKKKYTLLWSLNGFVQRMPSSKRR
ncbi:MAG: hypothetical protein ACI9LY_000105 [Arenicella sp.]|jgi:hypothetical protein